MAIDFNAWNEQFGGSEAVKALKEAKNNEYQEVADGLYMCKLDKLELTATKDNRPIVKGQFRINEGKFKNQCIFYNGVMAAKDPQYNGWLQSKVLEFLKSMEIFDDADIDFNGNFNDFNDLILDMAQESEGVIFEIKKTTKGDFAELDIVDIH
jgi:hypothetical protein